MNGKNVQLLVDDCSTCPKVIEGLSNVKLFFLPPNTTSKTQLYEDVAIEQQVGKDEGINGLHEAISGLCYRNAMDIEHLLDYACKHDTVIESPIDE
ncbi:hypothetical protein WN944_003532 [Citrus x changshan-huyou]|uniref:DDE-1 domain-containing protein n=1 Tax=Citrus x changshan-huyou TaxID=2935761 RepID=A0AAP0QI32_9ROSI